MNERPEIGVALIEYTGSELDGNRRVALLRDDLIVATLTDEEAIHLGHLLVDAAQDCDPTRIGRQEPTT